ncbi:MAG: hypothetical protein QF793_02930 [Candidatus Peribacteraceae bacterium]|jgi:hypothetical protein|nr:hypothetical protein [bacterium]MDP6561857.1 hypothetical protein [Candidatus Peribacteraceae bacterium]|tara:strand:- start:165 stop:1001 length:837 start_codon:yes stop_codon:yes gene_type:complete
MKRTFSLTLALLLLLAPLTLHAEASADSCRGRVNKELAREQRLYRAYLFGKQKAKDAPINDVRYDRDGWAWLKANNSGTPWINSDQDNQGLKWSNSLMDSRDEHSEILPIKGIFETKRVMTSELIPYTLQAIRSLECRMAALCEVSTISATQNGEDPQEIDSLQPVGCIEFKKLDTWPECHFDAPPRSVLDQVDTRNYCEEISMQLIFREIEQTKLAIEYDAGFRTLLQFAGNFDIFLREMRWPLTGTLRQAAELIGQLGRIPCFLSSCDSAPPIKQP